jgi:hypothetical protein
MPYRRGEVRGVGGAGYVYTTGEAYMWRRCRHGHAGTQVGQPTHTQKYPTGPQLCTKGPDHRRGIGRQKCKKCTATQGLTGACTFSSLFSLSSHRPCFHGLPMHPESPLRTMHTPALLASDAHSVRSSPHRPSPTATIHLPLPAPLVPPLLPLAAAPHSYTEAVILGSSPPSANRTTVGGLSINPATQTTAPRLLPSKRKLHCHVFNYPARPSRRQGIWRRHNRTILKRRPRALRRCEQNPTHAPPPPHQPPTFPTAPVLSRHGTGSPCLRGKGHFHSRHP